MLGQISKILSPVQKDYWTKKNLVKMLVQKYFFRNNFWAQKKFEFEIYWHLKNAVSEDVVYQKNYESK